MAARYLLLSPATFCHPSGELRHLQGAAGFSTSSHHLTTFWLTPCTNSPSLPCASQFFFRTSRPEKFFSRKHSECAPCRARVPPRQPNAPLRRSSPWRRSPSSD